MPQRELTQQEKAEQAERERLCRRFLNTFEGIGWFLLVMVCVFIAHSKGLLPFP
ncbi:hypothetical protein EAb13_CDS0117 [Acinetobacter phage EAb13]|nr:hypothetical protein EAb13_CDS0117 [Acinetobacter phage EAb13]